MCGVVGIISAKASAKWKSDVLFSLLLAAKARGTDATGIAYVKNDEMVVVKDGVSAEDFVVSEQYINATQNLPSIVMGHCRAATKGIDNGPEKNINNHPFYAEEGRIALMHNGVIEDHARWRESVGMSGAIKNKPISMVDSEVMLRAIETYYLAEKCKGDMMKAIDNATFSIAGNYVLGVLATDHPNKIWLVRHKNPISMAYMPGEEAIIFASEPDMISSALTDYDYYFNFFRKAKRPEFIVNSLSEDFAVEIEVLPEEPWFALTSLKLNPAENSSRCEKEVSNEGVMY